MKQTANIAASVKNLWVGSTLPALVPGGIIYGKIKAGTPYPYASLKITLDPDGTEWMTGQLYVQAYKISIRVWANQQVATTDAIQTALEALIGMTTKLALLANNAWTLQCVLEPAGIEEDEQRNLGTDIFIAGAVWTISLQENRNSG